MSRSFEVFTGRAISLVRYVIFAIFVAKIDFIGFLA